MYRLRLATLRVDTPLPPFSYPHDDVVFLVPARDEQDVITTTVRALSPHGRVVVIDNASQDETAHRAECAGATVVAETRLGYGSAIQAGLRHLSPDPPEIGSGRRPPTILAWSGRSSSLS